MGEASILAMTSFYDAQAWFAVEDDMILQVDKGNARVLSSHFISSTFPSKVWNN